jgi:AraC-like DNA-binding protein
MEKLTYALDTTWRTLFKDLGISAADVLRRASLPEDLLQQPSVRLPADDYYRLWRAIETETGPDLPLRLCEVVRSESFSPALFAALCSPNLLVAAQRIAQYKALVMPVRFGVTHVDGLIALSFGWPDGPPPPSSLIHMELLFCVTLARIGTRERLCPVEVTTTVLPAEQGSYDTFLSTPMRQGEVNRVVFDERAGLQPFLTSNGALWSAFEPELRHRLAELEDAAPISRRVKAALLESLPSGMVKIDAIARKLAVSRRTLQRRIEDEGSSYQQILQETRESLARHYLQKTALPPTEISFLLGFDEPNSFYRAFRMWTGTTPEHVRRHRVVPHPAGFESLPG